MDTQRPAGRPTLVELLRSSAALLSRCAAQAFAVLALGLVPGALLAAVVFVATGVVSREALNETIRSGDWLRASPLLLAGVVKRLLASLAFVALVFAVEARQAGRPLTTREAYGLAVSRFPAFLWTLALAVLRISGGLLLFVVPGLYLALRYTLAHLSVLLEDLRGKPALDRSASLVSADPLRALGFMLLATLLAVGLNVLCAVLVSVFTGVSAALGAGSVGVVQGQFEALAAELLESMVGAWLVCFSVLLYKDLAGRLPVPGRDRASA